MGCGNTKELKDDYAPSSTLTRNKNNKYFNKETFISLKHQPINYNRTLYGDIKLDKIVLELQNKLQEIEQFRVLIIDTLDKALIQSGACQFKSPTIETIFDCIMIKLSNDNEGVIKRSGIMIKKHKIEFTYNNCSSYTKELIECLENYFLVLDSMKEFNCEREIKELSDISRRHTKVLNQSILSLSDSNIIDNLKNIHEKNNSDIEFCVEVLNILEKEVNDSIQFRVSLCEKNFFDNLLNKKNYDFYGFSSYNNGITDSQSIVWDYLIADNQKLFDKYSEAPRKYRIMKENKNKWKDLIKKNLL